MRNLLVNQKIFSLRGEYWVEDELGNQVYQVVGSFMQIPKQFHILSPSGTELATVTHKIISLLPQFFVAIGDVDVATIKKKLTLFRPKYEVEGINNATSLQVQGNIWDMSFEIFWGDEQIGAVDKKWVSVRDRYIIQIVDDRFELLVVALVLAIDYVKRAEQNNNY
jgi:uncharacterized protein YxjI